MATTAVTIEDYLNGPIPDPDMEYVDGELKGKSLVQSVHGLLQVEIGIWFRQNFDAWGLIAAAEVRIQVSATRVRLPDVVVNEAGPWLSTLIEPPLIVVEILSPADSFTELTEKLREYEAMGIQNIWVVDPQARRSWTYEASALIEKSRFAVAGTAIYLDVPEMFARYDRYQMPRA